MRFSYLELLPWLSCILPTASANRVVERQIIPPSVIIDSGPLGGRVTHLVSSNTSVNQFLGIPYAKPPTGALRFRAPQSPQPWTTTYDATQQPAACMQWFGPESPARDVGLAIFNNPPAARESEDCLYINVYAPTGGTKDKPVLFWIHGGSGTFGSAALPLYDGTSFAANHDVVVVAANYRLNLFGYPTTTLLPLEERNLGLLDSRVALDWTRRNIQAFGGDPEKITIMGESAGAMAVGEFINTYPNNTPFRAGIMGSGSALVVPSIPSADRDTLWDKLLSHLNCTDEISDTGKLSCVKDAPAETLKEIINTNNLVFTKWYEDNVTHLADVGARWAAGNVAEVPILIGSTADEGSFPAMGLGDDVTLFIKELTGSNSVLASQVNSLYAPGSLGANNRTTGNAIISQIYTDMMLRCTSGFVANMTSTRLRQPVWQYLFDAQVPSITWPQWPSLGKYHSSELGMIFGTYPRENSTNVDVAMSTMMQKQIADFVKDPGAGPGWEQWPQIATWGLNGQEPVVKTEDVRKLDAVCAGWDQLYQTMVPELFSKVGGDGSIAEGSDLIGSGSSQTSGAPMSSVAFSMTIASLSVVAFLALL